MAFALTMIHDRLFEWTIHLRELDPDRLPFVHFRRLL